MRIVDRIAIVVLAACLSAGCYAQRGSSGGQQATFRPPRQVVAADIAVPRGYHVEVAASGLTFPTGVTFDGDGRPCVLEAGYSYGERWTQPRLLRIERDGSITTIATGQRNGPWTGVVFHDGAFYVAEGGESEGGRILRIEPDGRMRTLVEGLPSIGDHHTDGPAIGPDGWLYFGQGTATNSGVVGEDNAKFGWLARHAEFHDVPCEDVTLTGQDFESADPRTSDPHDRAHTGAYMPFGTTSTPGQVVKGRVPCSGAVMRVPLGGGPPELVAWGLRNPFGLAFAPDGALYVTDNGFDERGSRPIWGAGDALWRIVPGRWYGWPDYSAGRAVTDNDFKPPGKQQPRFVLAHHPGEVPAPVAIFDVHSSADGFDFARDAGFGHVGEAFVALFGDMTPGVGKLLSPVGFKVVRVDPARGLVEDFMVNRGRLNGPASKVGGHGLERPVAVRFDPSGQTLYVVDFGAMVAGAKGPVPYEKTGVLWRVTRQDTLSERVGHDERR
jgi:glucose/arabinose dehydrogenase